MANENAAKNEGNALESCERRDSNKTSNTSLQRSCNSSKNTMIDAASVDRMMTYAAIGTLAFWALLVGTLLLLCPVQDLESLAGVEREVPITACIALTVILGYYSIPLLDIPLISSSSSPSNGIRAWTFFTSSDEDKNPHTPKHAQTPSKRMSGIFFAAIVVVSISILTNVAMCFFPTMVRNDPVTGVRVFLLRWCEWTALSGIMTFMSEGTFSEDDLS